MAKKLSIIGCLVLVAAVSGCGQASDPKPATTGSPEAAKEYFEAVLHQDWPRAYERLDPEQRRLYSLARFTQLAQNYRKHLNFEPREVTVRSCEEHGTEAIAHLVLLGEDRSKQKFYKEAITLRSSSAGWGIVLPPKFGQTR